MQYTTLNIEQIKMLAQQYSLDEIIAYRILSGGSVNTNYFICSATTSYVLTICEQKSIEKTINLANLLEYLANNGFSTSKIISNKKEEPITIYEGKPVMLKKFLEGKIVENLSPRLLELIGIQMGMLHQIESPTYLPQKISYGVECFHEITFYDKDSPFHHWLKYIELQITPYLTDAMPKALIHSDVFYNNVIIGEDEWSVTIMDFEEATHYYRIFDISIAIIGLCSEKATINLTKVSHLLKGYTQEVALMDLEKKSLQIFTIYAAASMSFWRHRNFNYTNPTPNMTNHYLALKNIADHISQLPIDYFKKLLFS